MIGMSVQRTKRECYTRLPKKVHLFRYSYAFPRYVERYTLISIVEFVF